MVRLFFLSFFALWNFEFPAKIKKGGGEDPPDPLPPSLARSAVIAIFVQRPAVIVAPRRVTIEATSLPLSLMVGCCLLFGGTWYLCPLPLSYACLLSSSTGRAIVDEAAEGQSPMQSPPIFVEMEPAIIRHCLALRLALVAACQQAVFWCVTWFHPVWDTKYQKKSHMVLNLCFVGFVSIPT